MVLPNMSQSSPESQWIQRYAEATKINVTRITVQIRRRETQFGSREIQIRRPGIQLALPAALTFLNAPSVDAARWGRIVRA
jgi:hypothetical protein